ncbi:pneumococcal-type histidine triad protein [Streptococcus castoreus]|uniref:pneumococcal-type histidine triad protein n=1 Tax=Streptococcus castoreus TaxID=254786 RepID=UPI003CC697FE
MSALELEITKLIAKANGISIDDSTVSPIKPKSEKETDKSTPKDKLGLDKEEHHPVTPLQERQGKPNSKIVYSAEEIKAARAAGHYATSDGYIFDPSDIIADTGDGYVTPHMGHEHWIPKKELSEKELAAAKAFWEKKKGESVKKERPTEETAKPLTARALYESVKAEKIIPLEKMPYNAAYAVSVQGDYLVIPHLDHYHNLRFSWFDEGLYTAPEGYSLRDFFATIKYYLENPSALPKKEGWGSDSDHGKKGNKNISNTYKPDEEPTEKENSSAPMEEDDYDRQMAELAKKYGLDVKTLQSRLAKIALTYRVSMEAFSYQDTIIFTAKGKTIHYDIRNMTEVN